MGKTISEKILSAHSGVDAVAGDIVLADVDFVMGQDGTSPLAIKAFQMMGVKKVWDVKKVTMIIDHNAPSPVEGASNLHTMMREFAKEQNLEKFYDIGEGVCHQIMLEKGHVLPGKLVIGADSHTCTYGAIGAFSLGMGSTDIAAAMATGKAWFKVPETMKFIINNTLSKGVYSKDLILHIIGDIGADGASYTATEFYGEAIAALSVEGRMTMANMAIEMDAKVGIYPADEKTRTWAKQRSDAPFDMVKADNDATYLKTLEYDAAALEPQIAKPHTVDNVVPVSDVLGTPVQQAFLGTCTNGRMEDLAIAAGIVKGKKIHSDVRFIVAPASRTILLEGMKNGVIPTLVEAGAALVTAGCGGCVGTHNGVPSDGENVISTANRNFKGRMGNNKAFIYLASPATVAASALKGEIADPREVVQ